MDMNRWTIRKRNGRWRVYQDEWWWDTFDTLEDAHTYATQSAVADTLFNPGGLLKLANLKHIKQKYIYWTKGTD